jgi:hypothetical protein
MHRTTIAIGTFALLLAPAQAAHASRDKHAPRSCAPAIDTSVLASDPHAQVYVLFSRDDRASLRGCLRRDGHTVALDGQTDLTLAGTTVACVTGDPQEPTIAVRSIATGRLLHRATVHLVPTTKFENVIRVEPEVRRLIVKPDGSVAWVQRDMYARWGGSDAPPYLYSVFAIDRDGFRALTPVLTSEPRSLMLAGSALSWTVGASVETAVVD